MTLTETRAHAPAPAVAARPKSATLQAPGSAIVWQFVDSAQPIALIGRREGKVCGIITWRQDGYLVTDARTGRQFGSPQLDTAIGMLG